MAQTSKPFVAANQDLLRTAAILGEAFGQRPTALLKSPLSDWLIDCASLRLARETEESADANAGANQAQDVYW